MNRQAALGLLAGLVLGAFVTWLVVGNLEPEPSPSPSPSETPDVPAARQPVRSALVLFEEAGSCQGVKAPDLIVGKKNQDIVWELVSLCRQDQQVRLARFLETAVEDQPHPTPIPGHPFETAPRDEPTVPGRGASPAPPRPIIRGAVRDLGNRKFTYSYRVCIKGVPPVGRGPCPDVPGYFDALDPMIEIHK